MDDYDGDASAIWAPETSVAQVIERLMAFPGIGRKKSVMATEILTRHFGVELSGKESSQVAYDIQIRRVFLRTGLVDVDSREDVERAARHINPEAPGILDLPTWLIGRETCRPHAPLCDQCRLSEACPRRVWLTPVGVGARRASS
jgi:endonuclease III